VTDETLGVALKKLRAAAGMTQEELADRAGISARTVSDVERGLRTSVHGDTARRITAALGLSEQERVRFDALARGAAESAQPMEVPMSPVPMITAQLSRRAPTSVGGLDAITSPRRPCWQARVRRRAGRRVDHL